MLLPCNYTALTIIYLLLEKLVFVLGKWFWSTQCHKYLSLKMVQIAAARLSTRTGQPSVKMWLSWISCRVTGSLMKASTELPDKSLLIYNQRKIVLHSWVGKKTLRNWLRNQTSSEKRDSTKRRHQRHHQRLKFYLQNTFVCFCKAWHYLFFPESDVTEKTKEFIEFFFLVQF